MLAQCCYTLTLEGPLVSRRQIRWGSGPYTYRPLPQLAPNLRDGR